MRERKVEKAKRHLLLSRDHEATSDSYAILANDYIPTPVQLAAAVGHKTLLSKYFPGWHNTPPRPRLSFFVDMCFHHMCLMFVLLTLIYPRSFYFAEYEVVTAVCQCLIALPNYGYISFFGAWHLPLEQDQSAQLRSTIWAEGDSPSHAPKKVND